jgi:hypothetical protein
MTENELEKEVMIICKNPRKEAGVYKQLKRKFSDLKWADFHELWLKLIYCGSLKAAIDWKVRAPKTLNNLFIK